MRVGVIKEIWRYPVKSMFGEQVDSAWLESRGFADDRCWAVRDDISGEFVGGRKIPGLMMFKARYLEEPSGGFGPAAESIVEVECPDGRRIRSDDPYASAMLSFYLGQRVTLCSRPATRDKAQHRLRKPMSPAEIRYALGMKPDDRAPDFSSWSIKTLATVSRYTTPPGAFYDVYPVHFLTTAALEAMRGYYPEGDFRVERYRPNFLIETTPELAGLVENEWRGFDLQIGGARIHCHHPTIRCSMPGAAQPGMRKDGNIPLALMRHADQHLGAYASPRGDARIQVGDPVELVPKSTGRVYSWFDRVGRRVKSRVIDGSNRLVEWQEKLELESARGEKPVLPPGFRFFTIVDKVRESASVVSLYLTDPSRPALPRFVPGQHLVLALPGTAESFLYRPYSLSAGRTDCYRISVKRESIEIDGQRHSGEASCWLHDSTAVGDRIALKDPAGQFAVIPGDSDPLVMISSGIGVTPFMAMLSAIADSNPQRPVILLHGIRRTEDFAFCDELRELSGRLPKSRLRVFVSETEGGGLPALCRPGRMQVGYEVSELQGVESAKYLVCGSPAFVADIHKELLAANVAPSDILTEQFGLGNRVGTSDDKTYQINYSKSDHTASWNAQLGSLLSFTEAQGISVSSGCRFGACQACEVTAHSGEVGYPEGIKPPAGKNRVLLCSAVPESDLVLDL